MKLLKPVLRRITGRPPANITSRIADLEWAGKWENARESVCNSLWDQLSELRTPEADEIRRRLLP